MYIEPVRDLAHCYIRMETIRDYETMLRDPECIGKADRNAIDHLKERIVEMKRSVRKYLRRHRHNADEEPRIVHNDGIDGCIVLIPLPERITDPETAREWFDQNEYMQIRPSAYDCTGQLFTSWFKIVCRHGRYYAYHSICCDV